MNDLWNNNHIQFARLISELQAAGAFTDEIVQTLCTEMDLTETELFSIVERADRDFNDSKAKLSA